MVRLKLYNFAISLKNNKVCLNSTMVRLKLKQFEDTMNFIKRVSIPLWFD